MSAAAFSLQGQYYDGSHPIGLAATLIVNGSEATLVGLLESLQYVTSQLRVSPRVGLADRFIAFPDGAQLQCTDNPLLDYLQHESRSEGPVAWLEERLGVALASILVIICLLLVGYFYGLPSAAEHVAFRIPIHTEQSLGKVALAWLDKNRWFTPTKIEQDKQTGIRESFDELRRGLPMASCYRLEFRKAGFIGPNAFALPGGTIVITDELVEAAETREEVIAVLAHEIGHVELRHTLRQLLQGSAVAVMAAAVTADAASLSVAVTGLPVLLAQTKYSRKFETEADDYAFKLLKQRGHSPEAFADLMERFSQKNEHEKSDFSFLSTHPLTSERIARARRAGKD